MVQRLTYVFFSVQCCPVKQRFESGDRKVQLGLTHSKSILAAARPAKSAAFKREGLIVDLIMCK